MPTLPAVLATQGTAGTSLSLSVCVCVLVQILCVVGLRKVISSLLVPSTSDNGVDSAHDGLHCSSVAGPGQIIMVAKQCLELLWAYLLGGDAAGLQAFVHAF
jgi:hypothetical protein